MRLLANENFPEDAVEALKQAGHDVLWIRKDSPGISDREVLSRAQDENRILVNFEALAELNKTVTPAEAGMTLLDFCKRLQLYELSGPRSRCLVIARNHSAQLWI